DGADDAERPPDYQPVLMIVDLRYVTAADVFAKPGVIFDGMGEPPDFERCLAQGLALLASQEFSEIFFMSLKQGDGAPQHVGPFPLCPVAPDGESRVRVVNGLTRIFCGAAGDGVDRFPGRRIHYFDVVSAARADPFAADQHLSHKLSEKR